MKSGFVLDCSVAMTWCFEDEATPETDNILDQFKNRTALVPALWHLDNIVGQQDATSLSSKWLNLNLSVVPGPENPAKCGWPG